MFRIILPREIITVQEYDFLNKQTKKENIFAPINNNTYKMQYLKQDYENLSHYVLLSELINSLEIEENIILMIVQKTKDEKHTITLFSSKTLFVNLIDEITIEDIYSKDLSQKVQTLSKLLGINNMSVYTDSVLANLEYENVNIKIIPMKELRKQLLKKISYRYSHKYIFILFFLPILLLAMSYLSIDFYHQSNLENYNLQIELEYSQLQEEKNNKKKEILGKEGQAQNLSTLNGSNIDGVKIYEK